MMRNTASVIAIGGCLFLVCCATIGPTWSELSGARYHLAVADRRPMMIERIDLD